MDELTKLCDVLERRSLQKPRKNKMLLAKEIIVRKYGDNKDRRLELMALIKIHADNQVGVWGNLSIIISIFVIYSTVFYNAYESQERIIYWIASFGGVTLILTYLIIQICFYDRHTVRRKWMKYIDVALEDLEQNYFHKK